MNEQFTSQFGITKEDVLNLAAQKLADEYAGNCDLSGVAENLIREKVTAEISNRLKERVDAFLASEMTKLVSQEIVPVDIWGEKHGSATTIREQLAKRAREFWDVKVDGDGRESSYGGQPRSQQLMKQILKDEFAKAIKENAEVIIAEFKAALKADAIKLVTDHINKLINVKSR